jgi:hypothetical protein
MTETPKKTHRLQPTPSLSVRTLADYMAASHQARRTLLRKSKYQPLVAVTQHSHAKAAIVNWLAEKRPLDDLRETVARMRDSHFGPDEEFASETNQHNCDYIDSFIEVADSIEWPDAEFLPQPAPAKVVVNGTTIRFTPQMLVMRVTRANTTKIGALFLRYGKGQALPESAGIHQSAFTYGYLRENPFEPDAKPEHALCITLDCVTGRAYQAPSDSAVYLYKEMGAECASIAERWDSIPPPEGAVF